MSWQNQRRAEPDDFKYARPPCEGEGGGGGCLSYFITGNVGNCIMLPVWRAIGRFLRII